MRMAAMKAACVALAVAILVARPAAAFDPKAAESSVVRVIVTKQQDGKETGAGHGSGFVIHDEYVATNHHVAAASGVYKRYVVNPLLKEELVAELVWASEELDLAVLRVRGLKLAPLELTGRDPLTYPAKGQAVFVVGYPGVSDSLMLDPSKRNVAELIRQATVTRGVAGRTLNAPFGGKMRPVIQHDSAANPGNSGGPVFDACNRVVGVHTFSARNTLQVSQEQARGPVHAGAFFAPHISNLIGAVRSDAKLKDVRIRVSKEECVEASPGPSTAMIVLAGTTLAVVLAVGALVVFRRREVVRVVESYSAWINRKGLQPGAQRTDSAVIARARAARPAPKARPDGGSSRDAWTLRGRDTKQNAIALDVSRAELEAAAAKPEKGLVLGRSATMADKTIDDPSISRRHAKLTLTEAGLALEDLKSAYGTSVNGHKLDPFQPVIVEPGDQIAVGAVTLELGRG
jgi:hypothetical protein